jgi:hypothetical protein
MDDEGAASLSTSAETFAAGRVFRVILIRQSLFRLSGASSRSLHRNRQSVSSNGEASGRPRAFADWHQPVSPGQRPQEERQVGRALGEPPHEVPVPLRAERHIYAHLVAHAGQPPLFVIEGDPAPRRHRQPGRPGAWAPTPDQLEAPRRWPKNRNLSPTQQLAPIEHAPLPVR